MARTKRKVNPIIPAPTVELETPSAFLVAGYVRLSTEDSGKLGADVIEAQNVLVIGGSGSGKTRFHIKPNLMQMNASYIVTDPNR